MRATPRGDAGWRLCPPKLDRQPSVCKNTVLSLLTLGWVRSDRAFHMLFYKVLSQILCVFYCIYGIHLNFYPAIIDLDLSLAKL
jgi:hypothetical protein